MIGLDIVDLSFANGSKHQKDPRFINKIFSEEEQINFAKPLKDSTLLWVIWSMKESAYKAVSSEIQKDFNPKKIHLKTYLEKEQFIEGQVEYQNQRFHCRCNINDKRISCIALKDLEKFRNVKLDILKLESDSVDLARQVLNDSIRSFLNQMGNNNMQLEHLPSGKPIIVQSNEIKENISMSHHGHYTGFAYLPT